MLRIDCQAPVKYLRMDLAAIDRIGVATRVAITVALWARIAGAIPAGEKVVSVAGTGFGGGGADTAREAVVSGVPARGRSANIRGYPTEE